MKVKFEGSELAIRVPLNTTGVQSRSGNTTVIGSSRGNQFIGRWNGKPTYLQVNVLQSDHEIQTTGREGKPINVVDISTGRRKSAHSVGRKRRVASSA